MMMRSAVPRACFIHPQPRRLAQRRAGSMAERARRVVAGDRAALARAITLVESQRADHRVEACAGV